MAHLHLPDVHEATDALLRTVDEMTPEDYAAPSLLPDWSRAHVVSHIAMNARCFARAIEGAVHGPSVPVYASPEARDADIAEAAKLPADELREFLFDACGTWRDTVEDLSEGDLGAEIERTPGGPRLTISDGLLARWREVEIHHADLGMGWTPDDWSTDFVDEVLPGLVEFRSEEVDLSLESPEGTIQVGAGGATIRGSRARLAWWLMGRGAGEGLVGDLPTLGPWR
ncbi:hypothetical protein ASG90_18075 [Nocardioides sp. Soil797]|nr:hypothetical protein ASG90_18075 [Nocardioides sp. Soil797]